MSDRSLLMFGVCVTFIVLAGLYAFFRERYERGPQEAPRPIELPTDELRDARSTTRVSRCA